MSRYWCWTSRACRCPMVSPVRSTSPESPWPTATTADPTSPTRCSGRSRAGVRLYRTGDIGRRLPDGALVTDGRRGNQVKVRGHRVEPMEVELALRQAAAPHAGITDVAVIARPSSDGSSSGTQLVAFLVGEADEHAERAILASLRDVLPDYMIPARIEWLDALPRTASGKRADRELVTVPLRTRTVGYVAPRDEHEAVIAELVADVLGVPQVGVFDEFSSLSGDSLSAVRLIVAIEQRYGLSIPVSTLSTGPAVATLAVPGAGPCRRRIRPLRPDQADRKPAAVVPGPPDRRQRPVLRRAQQAPAAGTAALRVAGVGDRAGIGCFAIDFEDGAQLCRSDPPRPAARAISHRRLVTRWRDRLRNGLPAGSTGP